MESLSSLVCVVQNDELLHITQHNTSSITDFIQLLNRPEAGYFNLLHVLKADYILTSKI